VTAATRLATFGDTGAITATVHALNWNSDAIAWYDEIGGRGQRQRDSTSYPLSGPPLVELAGPR
jgi:hypothetical protein